LSGNKPASLPRLAHQPETRMVLRNRHANPDNFHLDDRPGRRQARTGRPGPALHREAPGRPGAGTRPALLPGCGARCGRSSVRSSAGLASCPKRDRRPAAQAASHCWPPMAAEPAAGPPWSQRAPGRCRVGQRRGARATASGLVERSAADGFVPCQVAAECAGEPGDCLACGLVADAIRKPGAGDAGGCHVGGGADGGQAFLDLGDGGPRA
jgi:hypothetical protein